MILMIVSDPVEVGHPSSFLLHRLPDLFDMVTFGLKASTKAEYLKALSDSFDYGEALLKEFSDAGFTETVKGPPWMGPSTRTRMVYDAIAHCQDIYGQMVVYLRLNGIVPPASRRGGV